MLLKATLISYLNLCLRYVNLPFKRLFLRFFFKKGYIYHPNEKTHFKKGEWVETKTGIQGKVWRLVRDIKTGEIKGCIVIWEDTYNGEKFSILPSKNLGDRFNPIIRELKILN